MDNFNNIKNNLKQGKSILHYPEIMEDKEMVMFAVSANVENYKHCGNFQNDKEIAIKVMKINISYLFFMGNKLKKDIEFAFELSKEKREVLYYFDDQIKFTKLAIDELTAKPNCKSNYLEALKKYDSQAYYKYYDKFPSEYKKIKNNNKYDSILIKSMLKKPSFAYMVEENIDMLNQHNILDNELILLLLNKREDDKSNIWKSLNLKDDSILNYFKDNYKYSITPTVMKKLLKNENFKKSYEEMYKKNPQKRDYKALIREVDLLNKVNNIEKEPIIHKIKVKI